MAINSGGLGATTPQVCMTASTAYGQPATPVVMNDSNIGTCSSWLYWFTPPCWCMSQDAWGQLASIPSVPAPTAGPSVPDTALSDPNAVLGDTSGSLSQSASNDQITQNQADVAAWAATLQDNPAGGALDACESITADWPAPFDSLTCQTWIMIGLAAAAALMLLGRK